MGNKLVANNDTYILYKTETLYTRWFKGTFLSPGWRSLSPLKRWLNHPKKVTKNCQWYIPVSPFYIHFCTSHFCNATFGKCWELQSPQKWREDFDRFLRRFPGGATEKQDRFKQVLKLEYFLGHHRRWWYLFVFLCENILDDIYFWELHIW